MKRANGLFIGVIFILIGLLYAGSAMDLFEFSIFFPGFWTLFIIIPCFYGLFKKGEEKTGYIIGLVVGLCFLINAQDFSFHIDFWPMVLALICIVIGIRMIFPENTKKKHIEFTYNSNSGEKTVDINGTKFDNTYSKDGSGYLNISALLSGKDVRLDNENFTGADICSVLGGVELDLRHAVISEDVYIRVTAILGGIDLRVPADVRVITDDCSAVLGGVEVNRAYANNQGPDAPRIIISGSCVLGGIEIK